MTGFYEDQEVLTDRLVIYRMRDSKRGSFYARILKGAGGYVRRSLKTSNKREATTKALRLLQEVELYEEHGFDASRAKSFNKVFEAYLHHRTHELHMTSTKYVEIYRRNFKVFFASNKNIASINNKKMSEYWEWRLRRWEHPDRKDNRRAHKLTGKAPSPTTLDHEVRLLNMFFRWCVEQDYIQSKRRPAIAHPIQERIEGINVRTRGVFTEKEYLSLVTRLRLKAEGKGKHAPKNGPERLAQYGFQRLYHYVLLMTATGVRPQEMSKLRFQDVKVVSKKPKLSSQVVKFCVVEVPPQVAKRKPSGERKGRLAVAHNGMEAYERIHSQWREWWESIHKRPPTDDDFLFPNHRHTDQPAEMSVVFSRCLERFDRTKTKKQPLLHKDSLGRVRGTYALRKFYISQRLKHGAPPNAVAKSVGSTIATIERYYDKTTSTDYLDELTAIVPEKLGGSVVME